MIDLGQRIVTARQAKGLRQKDLAVRAEMSASQLCQIENGRVSPTFAMVERLAAALDTDIAGLVAAAAPEPVRTQETDEAHDALGADYVPVRAVEPGAPKILRAILDVERERDALERARGLAEGCSVALNRAHLRYSGAGAALAEELRADLGFGVAPLVDLASALEFRGFRLYRQTLPKQTASVAFWNTRAGTPVVVLNGGDTPERHRYRLAYELASFCLYVSTGRCRLDESLSQHRFLTDFTAAFLMPGVTVRNYVAATGIASDAWTLDALISFKAIFGVSAEAFALRLEELGLIAPSLRLKFRDRLRAYYKSHPKDMEPRPRKGASGRWAVME